VKVLLVAALIALPAPCRADPAEAERQAQRALIERDRQAAEFSRPELRGMGQPGDAAPLRPDERLLRERDREAWLLRISPVLQTPAPPAPLPLPGGPGHTVDPIPVQGPGS
jgi:hypothetical protein